MYEYYLYFTGDLYMKKFIILSLLAISVLTLTGCPEENGDSSPRPHPFLQPNCVVVEDGCEYYVVSAYASNTFVHKGNCKNPIHPENWTDAEKARLLKISQEIK
jgi:hypothetical protein